MPIALGNIPLDGRVLTEADVLPYDSEVEYLESTGTQYIDTGIYADSSTTEFSLDCSFSGQFNPSETSIYILWGSDSTDKNPRKAFAINFGGKPSQGNRVYCWFNTVYKSGDTAYNFNTFALDRSTVRYTIGSVSRKSETVNTSYSTGARNRTLLLAAMRDDEDVIHPFSCYSMRVFGFSIRKNGTLVRDFIPVRKNGVGYLYDKVSGQLFGNAGTGAFLYGEDVQADVLIPRLANAVAVNTAISTINSNLNGIDEWLASGWKETAQLPVGSIASGWSFSPDGSTWNNKVRFFHWGQLGYIIGSLRKSSALAANTNSTSVGIITWPSGYTLIGAGGGLGDQRMNIVINVGGSISLLNISAVSANGGLTIRAFVPLGTIGDSWTRTEVETI